MKRLYLWAFWATIWVWGTGAGWAGPAEVVEAVGSGEINWSQGIIVARGSGAPPREARNIAQARLMTERAALADARRNLLEILRGVRVDSATQVENFMVRSDEVRLQSEGFIQGSVEWKQFRRYLSDGAVEVTLAMSLSGDFLSLMLRSAGERPKEPAGSLSRVEEPKPEKKGPAEPPQIVPGVDPGPPPSEAVPEKKPETPILPVKPAEEPLADPADLPKYTGLVIDARGSGMKPALLPRILDGEGREIYRGNYVPPEKAAQNGVALFSRDLTAAQTNPRVGKNPLTLKGMKVDPANPADLVLAKEAARKLAPFARKGTFLEECRVLIVLD